MAHFEVTLPIQVANVDTVLQDFDLIEVHRDTGGGFSLYTATTATKGTITGTVAGPYSVVGDNAILAVEAAPAITVNLAGSNPLTVGNIADQLNAAHTRAIFDFEEATGYLTVETVATGSGASLLFTAGSFPTALGLPTTLTTGADAHIALVSGTELYTYVDGSSADTYKYKVRFKNSVTGHLSDFSNEFTADETPGVVTGDLITGTIDLADIDGTPLEGIEVTVYNPYSPLGKNPTSPVFVLAGRSKTKTTDAQGHAEFTLVYSQVIDVTIQGTQIVRRITVPSSGVTFDLMDDSLVIGDPFEIKVPNIPIGVRTS